MASLHAFLLNILKSSLWLAILVVVFVPLERCFAVHTYKPLRKGIGTDLCYYFLNSLLPAVILSVPAALLGWSVRHVIPGSVLALTAPLPFWAKALAGFVAGEVGYYWGHRWSHEIPFLWRFHAIHHSAEEVDFLVNSRAHPLDMVFSRFCMIVPMYILGLAGPTNAAGGSTLPVLLTLIGITWGFCIHANLRWSFGPLEWLVSTPKFHHWHHTKTGLIDHNYASTFPWLDRLFGTHNLPKEWPESYGIEAKMPHTLFDQLAYPLLPEDSPVAEQSADVARASD
jgi:sterol desaturase/sphingolipid hydroxylase (fatty acid hydroxylase superfamily)